MSLEIYAEALSQMESLFASLVGDVPPPAQVQRSDGFVFRYLERLPTQAIVQKLARSLSTLHAALVLLQAGHYQELAALQRILDDFHEEVVFLALALLTDDISGVHEKYLEGFWMEVIDEPADPLASASKKLPTVSRKDLRAAIRHSVSKMSPDGFPDWSEFEDSTRIVSAVYNGFVHGGSPQIMEMYGGLPPRFHLKGMLGTPRQAGHERDLRNQFYRTATSFTFAAMVVADERVLSAAYALCQRLAVAVGLDEGTAPS
jgi:hypothetical protein